LPFKVEETIIVGRLFPECVITQTEVVDSQIHNPLDNLVIVPLSNDEFQWSSILILSG
jgi:hypothetical protein